MFYLERKSLRTPTIRITTFPIFLLGKSLDKLFNTEVNHCQNQYPDDYVLKDE